MKSRFPGSRWRLILAIAVLACLIGGAVLLVDAYSRRKWAPFEKLAADVVSGALPVSADGVVQLPAGMRGLSVDGFAYVTRTPGGGMYIVIPTWRGKGSNMIGFMYSTTSLAAPTIVSAILPDAPPPELRYPPTTAAFAAFRNNVEVPAHLYARWYRVSQNLD